MENTAKKYGRLLCFTPMTLFALWTVYFFTIVKEEVVTSSFSDHFQWVAAMAANYNSLWISLAIICTISAAILLYLTVHIARLKSMSPLEKLFWLISFPSFGAFAFILFYFLELRNEPEDVDVYPSIA